MEWDAVPGHVDSERYILWSNTVNVKAYLKLSDEPQLNNYSRIIKTAPRKFIEFRFWKIRQIRNVALDKYQLLETFYGVYSCWVQRKRCIKKRFLFCNLYDLFLVAPEWNTIIITRMTHRLRYIHTHTHTYTHKSYSQIPRVKRYNLCNLTRARHSTAPRDSLKSSPHMATTIAHAITIRIHIYCVQPHIV